MLKNLGISLLGAIGIATLWYWLLAPTFSSGFLLGIGLFIIGLVVYIIAQKGSILKQIALIASLSGIILAIVTIGAIMVLLTNM
ncbi:hypothetical protein [Lederbergia galactosidilytica]|uniref:Uncharacterized protein n=1 Tax=Lederbergia galactosidilytica TaxID=217031 RepID=A0A0Q9Y1H7_9BACI|nr:hypothetical protein [Lederbergia galactosidilytica]KRG09427.1 hypothetical protein ACA29_24090 [Lederbergia galactosidilytica]KRG16170.1 hypothetical protein ACA30_02540 [Virgibacillus soli]MBP1914029.1 hypothetical protein [Lederbergia galactosidilytica]OAK75600.1 hypothetical protein ABB05_01180 [Lederbergia galactosidilytica]